MALNYNKGVDYYDYNKLKYNTTTYRPLHDDYPLYFIYHTLYFKSK